MNSEYATNLKGDVGARYSNKIELCDGIDPFIITSKGSSRDLKLLPKTSYIDLYNYLVFKTSFYTNEMLCAYKSLESFKLYENGWVRDLFLHPLVSKTIIIAEVSHSQQLNLKPVNCWILCDNGGEILCAHCLCIAGLGEVCTHVGATLFAVESLARSSQLQSKTDVLAVWPNKSTPVAEMRKIKDIQKYLRTKTKASVKPTIEIPPMNEQEIFNLLKDIEQSTGMTPAALLITTDPSNKQPTTFDDEILITTDPSNIQPTTFVDEIENLDIVVNEVEVETEFCDLESQPYHRRALFLFLVQLFKTEYLQLSLDELREVADGINITYSKDDILFIENITKGQSNNWYWKKFRFGRVTASIFKQVCRTSISKPSISLIKQICWPEKTEFFSKAIDYGRQHEKDALDDLKTFMVTKHTHYNVEECGLIINPKHPLFGASPDGISQCDCCGKGCIEIKCPYTLKDETDFKKLLTLKDPFLKYSEITNTYDIIQTHKYYYQMQMQIFITEVEFCDFCIWSSKEVLVLRINRNNHFWIPNAEKASIFARKVLLPEILRNYYSKTGRE